MSPKSVSNNSHHSTPAFVGSLICRSLHANQIEAHAIDGGWYATYTIVRRLFTHRNVSNATHEIGPSG